MTSVVWPPTAVTIIRAAFNKFAGSISGRTDMNVYMDTEFKDWILGGVIREASLLAESEINIRYISTSRRKRTLKYLINRYLKKIKVNKHDLIVNQGTLNYLVSKGMISKADLPGIRCHFTHDTQENLTKSGLIEILKSIRQVLVLNKSDYSMLRNLGVEENRLRIIYGAVDRKLFYPVENSNYRDFVLITGDCKARKNPRKILEVVTYNPDLNFIICGRYWNKFISGLERQLQNLTVFDFSMEQNALLMREASAYMTLSLQEGGPFPVLEALASGTPVLSTPVGWVPEIVNYQNGRIVAHSSSVKEISDQLRECLAMKEHTWADDLLNGKYTWQELSAEFFEIPEEESDDKS